MKGKHMSVLHNASLKNILEHVLILHCQIASLGAEPSLQSYTFFRETWPETVFCTSSLFALPSIQAMPKEMFKDDLHFSWQGQHFGLLYE